MKVACGREKLEAILKGEGEALLRVAIERGGAGDVEWRRRCATGDRLNH
jgi:hypothetical protein